MVEFPEEFRTAPYSFYLWGRSPRAGHILAFTIARLGDASFRWLSVRESADAPTDESWVRRFVPESRILPPLLSDALRPGRRVSKEAVNSLIRSDGDASERTSLEHYLLLPAPLQELLDGDDHAARVRAIVVANTERIRGLYPTDPGRMRPFADIFSRHGVSMISTSLPPPYEGRYAFDIVLRLDVASSDEWRVGRLVVEKGLRSGEFRTGASFSLDELPWYLASGEAIENAES